MAQRRALARWCGADIVELATPDFRDMVYVDTWFWSNRGWDAFGIQKPPEYASPEGLAAYVKGKGPESVLVALTHDHNDHIGDYFATLTALAGAGLDSRPSPRPTWPAPGSSSSIATPGSTRPRSS